MVLLVAAPVHAVDGVAEGVKLVVAANLAGVHDAPAPSSAGARQHGTCHRVRVRARLAGNRHGSLQGRAATGGGRGGHQLLIIPQTDRTVCAPRLSPNIQTSLSAANCVAMKRYAALQAAAMSLAMAPFTM